MSRALRLALLGISFCALAGAFAVSPLYVAGVVLILLALAAELTVRLAAHRAEVTLKLAADTVEEGAAAKLTVGAGGWPPALSRAELCAAPGASWRLLPPQGAQIELEVSPPRRGELVVGPAAVRFADPFGICARERISRPGRLLVLPRVERIRRDDLDRLVGLGRSAPRQDGGTGVAGLRPYREGAPASRIHWLSVARRGALVERRFEEDAEEAAVTVALETRSPAGEEALDMAVRAAASLCVGLATVGGCSLLLPGWGAAHPIRADLASWPSLHARLALVAAGQELDWRVVTRARLIVLVSAAGGEPTRAAVGCTVSPLRAERPVLFEVAGCAVQSAGRTAERAA